MQRIPADLAHRIAWAGAIVLGVLVTVLLPLSFPPGGGQTGFDHAIADRIHRALDAHHWVYQALVVPSDVSTVLPVLALGVIWYAWHRHWWAVGFLLVAPELTVAVNELVLKPHWHRHLHDYLAYPSGHTVQFIAIAMGFVLMARTTRARVIEIIITAVGLMAIAIGMIGFDYHNPTDIVGGTAAAIVLVLVQYGVLRVIRDRRSGSPRSRTTAATAGR